MGDVAVRQKTDLIEFDEDQVGLIKRTVLRPKNRDASNDELALLVHQSQRTGLDPLARQIYGVYRFDKKVGQEVMTIQTGIDGFRLIAERTGKYLGQTPTYWLDKDGAWHEVWTQPGAPVAAKVGVHKAGASEPTWAVAKTSSYNAGGPLWSRMPDLMIGKCAEALALRKAFPAELSGLYIPEETERNEDAPGPADAEVVDAEVVETIGSDRIEKIEKGFRVLGLTLGNINALLGAAGLNGLRARSKKAVGERLRELTADEADKLEAELNRRADVEATA